MSRLPAQKPTRQPAMLKPLLIVVNSTASRFAPSTERMLGVS